MSEVRQLGLFDLETNFKGYMQVLEESCMEILARREHHLKYGIDIYAEVELTEVDQDDYEQLSIPSYEDDLRDVLQGILETVNEGEPNEQDVWDMFVLTDWVHAQDEAARRISFYAYGESFGGRAGELFRSRAGDKMARTKSQEDIDIDRILERRMGRS